MKPEEIKYARLVLKEQKKIKPHNVPKKLCIEGKGKDGYCVTNFSKGGTACESCPIKQNSAHGYTEGSESNFKFDYGQIKQETKSMREQQKKEELRKEFKKWFPVFNKQTANDAFDWLYSKLQPPDRRT